MRRGFTLVELLMVLVIASIIMVSLFGLWNTTRIAFGKVKTVSQVSDITRSTIVLLDRYFDRWGAGVPTSNASTNCNQYPPPREKCITIVPGPNCDEVSFYASLYGIGMAYDNLGNVIGCRLRPGDCYYIIRGENFVGNPPTIYQINNVNLTGSECVSPTFSANSPNYVVGGISLQPGDIIIRVPHRVRLFCQNLNGQLYLYAELTDMASSCGRNEPAFPIAPVKTFKVRCIPNPTNCSAVRVELTLLSEDISFEKKKGEFYIVRTFGR